MEPRRRLILGVDLARVQDSPALCVVDATYHDTGEITHSDEWHRTNRGCERPYCRETTETHFRVRYLDRLRRPGKEAGVAPIAELVRLWVLDLQRKYPHVPIHVFVDVSGGDYRGFFDDALAGTSATLTGVEMTAGDKDGGHSLGSRWLRISRTRLLWNLERRFERRQVRMPREAFDKVRGELFAMRRTVTDSRNVVFVSSAHDDVVVALGLATWPDPFGPETSVRVEPASLIWD